MPVCRVIADAQEVRFAVAREHACQPAGAGVCQTASAAQERLDYETAVRMEADDQVRTHMCVSSHTHTHTHTHIMNIFTYIYRLVCYAYKY